MSNLEITIFQNKNKTRGNVSPKGFTTKYEIASGDVETLAKAVSYDNCLAEYRDGYKHGDNFIKANCILADIDNTHSENENDWITHDDVIKALPNIEFYYYPSRNNMKEKDGRKARPKEHYIFPTEVLNSLQEYTDLMHRVIDSFPYLHFDKAVKGGAQLNFGVENPIVKYVYGEERISTFIQRNNTFKQVKSVENKIEDVEVIPQGRRHNTLLSSACRILKKYGETKEAEKLYINETEKCSPCLDKKEIQSIWDSAISFYNEVIKTDASYVSPDEYSKKYKRRKYALPIVDDEELKQIYAIDTSMRKFNIESAKRILKIFGISIKYNDMNRKMEVYGLPKKYNHENASEILLTLVEDIANDLCFKRAKTNVVHNTLNVIANENHYHPVIELLTQKEWDKTDRLKDIYEMLNLTDDMYKALVRKWAVQTIAILFNSDETPVSTQGVLVLQGNQGIGKTQFFSHLAIKDSFFKGGATLDMSNKDSYMSATKVWICELGEIDNTTKKEQSSLKAFLTEQVDHYREPYAKTETKRYRHTSFCGTVNPQWYLRDETGNRRYWTIPIENINLIKVFGFTPEWYTEFWRQMFAEYKANPKGYLLTEDEKQFVNQTNTNFEVDLLGEDEFMTLFDFEAHISKWECLTAAQIANLLNENFKGLRITSSQVGKMLNRIEHRRGKKFYRKKIHGRKLIECPPVSIYTDDKKSDIPPYVKPNFYN